ncbi:MAG: hypothetical protein CL961_04735 [Euryarchaeota archaeon]|nr:hypothetical protein [Euryarchaeota archaeon]
MNFNVTVLGGHMAASYLDSNNRPKGVILLMTILLTIHLFIPFVSADGMNTCQGVSSGVCDDYSESHDLTPSQQDWVNGTYDFQLVDTDTITLEMVWAIHEFNRSSLGLDNIAGIETLLQSDGIDEEDGAPADLIRTYFDQRPNGQGTPTVRDQLKIELNNALETSIENGFGNIVGLTTDYTPSITQQGDTIPCSDDPLTDSVYSGEGASENNAFYPPICISSTFTIELTDTAFSLDSTGNLDLERAFQGMLVMGAEINTNFTLLTLPGHIGFYSFSPPSYANITQVGAGGTLAARSGPPAYFAGEWTVNRLNDNDEKETPISVRLAHRDGSLGTNTVSIAPETKAIDLNVKLDLRDESAASIDFVAGISYLDDDLLSDWGISLLNLSDTATLPLVTSDGIRLAYHNGLVELDQLTSAFPINDIAGGISDSVGSDEVITMNDLYWVSDALTDGLPIAGGLNYTHSSGCTEAPQGQQLNYCIQGTSAMSAEYPVYLRSTSQPFSMSLIDILKNNFDDGDLLEYVDVLQESDLRNLLNSGLSIESVLPGSYLDSVIPDGLPPAELTLEIILPTWVRTIDGEDRLILEKSLEGSQDVDISLAGTDPYDWRTDIRDEDMNVVCTTLQRTCISSQIELDISAFRINEWSQSVSLDFALDAEVSIYRVMIPLEEIDQSGSTRVNFEAAPSDLVRVGLDIASRLAQPKTFDDVGSICSEDQTYDVCDTNLSLQFTPEGLTDFSEDIGDIITQFIHESSAELPDVEDSPFGDVDLSGFQIKTKVEGLTGLDQDIGDDEPITLSVRIPEVEFKLELDGDLGEIAGGNTSSMELNFFANAFRGLVVNPMVSAAELLGSSLTNGLVSGSGITYPDPSGDKASYSFSGNTSIAEEYDLSLTGPVSIILPRGITIEDVEDTGGYLDITEVGGRQKITYNIPDGEFEDTISFRIKVSWLYLLMQFWVYPTFVVILLALFIRRRRRKKRLKKARKAANQQTATKVTIGDSEFADLRGFHSEGLHGDLEQFEDYSNKGPPPMVDLPDKRFD